MAVDSLSAPPARGPEAGAPPSAYADWSHRLVAMLLDLGIVSFATWLIAGQAPILAPAPVWGANPAEHTWPEAWTPAWWGLAALYSAYVCLQAWTGATPGKAALGIRVLGDTSGRPIGILGTILRWLAHLIDAILFIGYLRPLWHPRRQTFADSLLHTVVVRNTPRRVGLWRVAALIVGLVAGGLSLVSASGSSSTVEAGASCTAADDTHVTASVERVDRWSERGFIRRDEPATWSIALDIRGLAARTHSIEPRPAAASGTSRCPVTREPRRRTTSRTSTT